jgi:F420-dependent methylenetetrahydromethanopterin dehydrogenase
MKNRLSDLNNHLFAQLERLADENLTAEQIKRETERGTAIVAVADQIIRNAALQIAAAKLVSDHGFDPTPHLPLLEGSAMSKATNGRTQ